MYNFNDHTLCRELSKNIPQLEIKSISKLERSNVISFIGTFEEYSSYLPQINNLLGINNDVIKNLFTDNSKITAKRVNINDQDLITINYSNNKIDNDLTEQALSKICELLVSKLRNDDSASITFLLTPNFCEKLPNLSTFFNAFSCIFKTIEFQILLTHVHCRLRAVHGVNGKRSVLHCIHGETSGITEQIEHFAPLGILPYQRAVLPLVQEETGLLPLYPINHKFISMLKHIRGRLSLFVQVLIMLRRRINFTLCGCGRRALIINRIKLISLFFK